MKGKVKHKKYQTATKQQTDDILTEADEWMKTAPNIKMFSDARSITRRSVAEYIANQKGLTLWPVFF